MNNANMMHVHAPDKLGGVYDANGTVGVLLTAAKHDLNKLPGKRPLRREDVCRMMVNWFY